MNSHANFVGFQNQPYFNTPTTGRLRLVDQLMETVKAIQLGDRMAPEYAWAASFGDIETKPMAVSVAKAAMPSAVTGSRDALSRASGSAAQARVRYDIRSQSNTTLTPLARRAGICEFLDS